MIDQTQVVTTRTPTLLYEIMLGERSLISREQLKDWHVGKNTV